MKWEGKMATLSGNFRETNIPTIAAMISLIDAFLTAQAARVTALGGTLTNTTGHITLIFRAAVLGVWFSHRVNVTLNCQTLADLTTLTAALSVFATAVETESSFTIIVDVETAINVSMLYT